MSEVINQPLFSDVDCRKILNKYTQEHCTLVNYEVKNFSESTLGFLSEHLTLSIKYKIKSNDQVQTANFFVKTMPRSNVSQNDYIREMNVFNKEARLFKNLLSSFLKTSPRQFAPKCYLTKEDSYIVLEDLCKTGYKISNTSYLSFDQMVSLLKSIASFHAASVVFEEERSGPYCLADHFPEELQETTFSFVKGHPRNHWCINVSKCIQDCIMVQSRYENKQKLYKRIEEVIFKKMPTYIKPSQKFRNVVNHDDLWSNNLMFNEDSNCVIVDFQLARYVPAAYDVLMALYLNSRRDFLKNNFGVFLNIYYESLAKELKRHEIDIESVYTKQQFSDSIKTYCLPALTECVMFGTIVYLPQDLADKVVSDMDVFREFMFENRSKYVVKEYLNNKVFRSRLNDVLMPLIEYLDQLED